MDFDFKWENKSVLEIAESNYSIREKAQNPETQIKEPQLSSEESSPESLDLENNQNKENIDSNEEEEKIEEGDSSNENKKKKDIVIDLDYEYKVKVGEKP